MILFTCKKDFLNRKIISYYIKNIFSGTIIKKAPRNVTENQINRNIEEQFNKKISFKEIVQSFIKNIKINATEDEFQLELSEFVKLKDIPLIQIIRFIDKGNLSFKGFNIFNKSIECAKKEIYLNNPILSFILL